MTASRGVLAADVAQVNLTAWTPPDIKTVGDDAFGKLVKYGFALIAKWASTGIPDGAKLVGSGASSVKSVGNPSRPTTMARYGLT